MSNNLNPDQEPERKEWVRLSHSPTATMVSVTLQQGTQTVKWTVKTYSSAVGIKAGVQEARGGAIRALGHMQAALDALAEEMAA